MTSQLEDLPPEQQAKIRELADAAVPLTDRQRERLQLLLRQAEVGDAP